jgi:oxygen-independent coproporphyrinogen-3 oxidase
VNQEAGPATTGAAAERAGIYLHVPFCASICSYCNFNRGLYDEALKTAYLDALEREIRRPPQAPGAGAAGRGADTIFFGGGTPSLLDPGDVSRLVRACRETFALAPDAEITLEANPETVTPERLDGFRAAGVNRISFGVQSFDDAELARLGRVHSAERARTAIRDARAAGFGNLSFDLMLWLPGQSLASWLRTVDAAVALAPDHLSLYLLELYPNAPLREAMARAPWLQAPDDEAADMYLAALERLEAAGLAQYEISNVARPGRASRHNVKYWQGGDWWGFGCGAHATVGGRRWQNVADTREYIDRLGAGRDVAVHRRDLPAAERVGEALFTGLRMTAGLDRQAFEARYGLDPWVRYREELARFAEAGLLWAREGRLGLTRPGMLMANEVLVTFV